MNMNEVLAYFLLLLLHFVGAHLLICLSCSIVTIEPKNSETQFMDDFFMETIHCGSQTNTTKPKSMMRIIQKCQKIFLNICQDMYWVQN